MDKKTIKITFKDPYMKALDQLVDVGIYLDYQSIIREALRNLFRSYEIEPFNK